MDSTYILLIGITICLVGIGGRYIIKAYHYSYLTRNKLNSDDKVKEYKRYRLLKGIALAFQVIGVVIAAIGVLI